MITTEAWVLPRGPGDGTPGELRLERISFEEPSDDEVLVEPLYGCWEGNMTHALERSPVDVCRQRGEAGIVLGNAGVVRILHAGRSVRGLREGDLCGLASGVDWDPAGYPKTILGYDAPGTSGVLAKRLKLRPEQLFLLPPATRHSLPQWAAFTIRYVTAWDNWQVAHGAWQLQMKHMAQRPVHVWSWGGGVGLGELLLAREAGLQATMICGSDRRIALCERLGLQTLDRRRYDGLAYDDARFAGDLAYRRRYMQAELAFLDDVRQRTDGAGVSIFIDNIGASVYRATLNALARQGVIATSGWKTGLQLAVNRGRECIARHIHVYTHGSRNSLEASVHAERAGWLPPLDEPAWPWDRIPELAARYGRGEVDTYFPVFEVNPP
ncbi:MAG: zinc-binding dehydrogenase [Proteobacteria bacterium]|nr:zinc-binding dehydrogenase [Pseudomonadota bacterium]